MSHRPLPLSHALLALAVAFVWGTNFVVIHTGLTRLPPLLFAALRFAFAFFPAALFIRRPAGALGASRRLWGPDRTWGSSGCSTSP